MNNDRKQPGAALWATALVFMALLYPLSVGPAIWLFDHKMMPGWARNPVEWFYAPLDWIAHQGPDPIRAPLFWYAELWRSKP